MELVSIKVSWTPVQKRGVEFAIDNGSELCDSSGAMDKVRLCGCTTQLLVKG